MFCSKIAIFPFPSHFKTSSWETDDSMAKLMHCSVRGPKFSSKHQWTSIEAIWHFLTSGGTALMCKIYINSLRFVASFSLKRWVYMYACILYACMHVCLYMNNAHILTDSHKHKYILTISWVNFCCLYIVSETTLYWITNYGVHLKRS